MENTTANTVGQILREAREKRQLSVARVNQETRMSPEVIRALEEDDHSSFVSDTYLKGFLRQYAQFLGLNPDELWATLSRGRDGGGDAGAAVWDTEQSLREEKLSSPHIFRRFVLPALIVIILVLSFLLWRANRQVQTLTTGMATPHVSGEVMVDAREI